MMKDLGCTLARSLSRCGFRGLVASSLGHRIQRCEQSTGLSSGPGRRVWTVLCLVLILGGCGGNPAPPTGREPTDVKTPQQQKPVEEDISAMPSEIPHEDDKVTEPEGRQTGAGGDGSTLNEEASSEGSGRSATVLENRAVPESQAVSADDNKLIPRQVLFGNPEKASPRISPDGRWLSYLAPDEGVLNVWVGPVEDPSRARPVTRDRKRGIRVYMWAYDGRHILYVQDEAGDENWHLYATDVESATTRDLTPLPKIHATIEGISERQPGKVLVGINDRDPQLHDIYLVDIAEGTRELVQQNPGFAGFLADDDYRIRLAMTYTPEGGQQILQPDGQGGWSEFARIGSVDAMTTAPAGFDKTGDTLYLIDSRDRNTAALFALDLKTRESRLLAENDRADIGEVLAHPTEKNIQAAAFVYTRKEWQVLDESIADDLKTLEQVEDGELTVTSRTLDDRLWTVAFILDNGPVRYHVYDRAAKEARFLFASRSDLDQYRLARMEPVEIPARDGLTLVSYLTLPHGSDADGNGRPDEPLALVLDVHGGPWSRDTWGFNPIHQWLANRGHAVLSVNFRGSTGFGKDFINAANGQWSRKMHDDLLDATQWAIDQGIARRDRVAIMGGSYGGYATLVGLTLTPDVFACGVDIVGPSNLVTLLQNAPPYWMPFMPVLKDRVGDPGTEEGRAALLEKSPLTYAKQIRRPLLIAQGANDPRVTQIESDQIVGAMAEKGIPVTYVLYPDEGHGFARPENRLSFYAVAEAFLAEHLGGRFEPVGEDFAGASITVPTGADQVPGLGEALEQVAPAGNP